METKNRGLQRSDRIFVPNRVELMFDLLWTLLIKIVDMLMG